MISKNLSKFYINGAWVAPLGGTMMGVENPANEEIVAEVALGSVADADRAIAAARDAFLSYTTTPVADRIALLKIDCEGCEWDAFSHMAAFDHHAMDGIVLLMIEVHLVTSLKMAGHADFLKFQRFFEYLFEEQGFRFFFHHANWGMTRDVHPEMVRLGARPNHCCFEIGLVKPHLIEHLLAN